MEDDDECEEKCVLAHLLEHARPVKFSGGKAELESAVRETYKDVLQEGHQLFLKVRSIIYKKSTFYANSDYG